jgi:hypothetical protein
MLTYEELNEVLQYCPITGILYWKVDIGTRARVGTEAGYLHRATGYKRVMVNKVLNQAHRVCWLLYYGTWPTNYIDHISGDRSDNRVSNLRDVTKRQNGRNQKKPITNTSGILGVNWSSRANKWVARGHTNIKRESLGYFDTIEEAAAAREAFNKKHNYHENHGR